jgi:type IV secretion system protein VirD4
VLATTARGQGIQLVTVWHDKSQLEARYGPKASTILSNHRAKLFLSGWPTYRHSSWARG